MSIRSLVAGAVTGMAMLPVPGFGQTALPIVDRFDRGSAVTIQGCVKPAAQRGAHVLTQIVTWPILRTATGPYGPHHFWTRQSAIQFGEFDGDTLQLTGKVVAVRESEIETEPGLRRFGGLVELESPGGNLLVDPATINLAMDRVPRKSDVSITSVELDVSAMMRVMRGCLPAPAGTGTRSTAARRPQ